MSYQFLKHYLKTFGLIIFTTMFFIFVAVRFPIALGITGMTIMMGAIVYIIALATYSKADVNDTIYDWGD